MQASAAAHVGGIIDIRIHFASAGTELVLYTPALSSTECCGCVIPTSASIQHVQW